MNTEENSSNNRSKHNTSGIAKERWKLLAQILQNGEKSYENNIKSSVSIRRFQSFGLFNVKTISEDKAVLWQDYSLTQHSTQFHLSVSEIKCKIDADKLQGFNNTGNICIWPAEEIMAYYCLVNKHKFQNKSVIELGGGMTCLAGFTIAATSDASFVKVTDGNEDSVKNLSAMVDRNQQKFHKTEVTSSLFRWGSGQLEDCLQEKFDYVLCSDWKYLANIYQNYPNNMAAMVRLQRQVNNIVEETYARKNEAEERRNQEFLAAVEIQSWFRGCRTRGYLKFLNRCATSVQRRWRGFLGRRFYRVLIQNSVFQAKLRFYNQQASKIQKVWKGYYIRKYVFNYYSRKQYLESLQIKNEIIRSELEEYAEQQSQIRQQQADEEERQARIYEARKNHYLISTEVIPGVYNSPFLPFPSANEYVLRNVKPLDKKKRLAKKSDPGWKSCEFPRPEKLPPLVNKPQGPFREPADVQSQRYKNFQPSLRVATDFFSLEDARKTMKAEEWVTRINDDLFLPVGKKEARYQPLLYTTSKYGHLPYGTKYFREEHIDKHITPQPFKTLVPPIPVFDKLNNTYSQGQV